MARRALRLTVTDHLSPDLLVPVTSEALLVEQEDGSVTVTVRLRGASAEAARRGFRAAGASDLLLPDRVA
jgi:hypothetical protein